MSPAELDRLKGVLASFDEAGLVALSNKGLVRRAMKDLQGESLTSEETEKGILVRGAGWTVTMPAAGPAAATDDTRASGITRQILMATIYLRDLWNVSVQTLADPVQPREPTDAPSADMIALVESEALHTPKIVAGSSEIPLPCPAASDDVRILLGVLETITLDDLRKWAGKTLVKEVQALLNPALTLDVETHAGVTIRLIQHDVEARLLPGDTANSTKRLLDGMLTTARKAQHKRFVVLTVLAYQVSRGVVWEEADQQTIVVDSPRTQSRVLATVRKVLETMVATGLAHPSERIQSRLLTLSMTVAALRLPRLSRRLRALADDVGWILARDAQASTEGFFDRLCTTHALARALVNSGSTPPVALAGRSRSEYEPAGNLSLAGVGAFPWKTPSGFVGVTSLFWDQTGGRFHSYSASRPVNQSLGFNVERAYQHETVWTGGGSLEELSRSRLTLQRAKANAEGRLSASASSTVERVEQTEPEAIDFGERIFRDWSKLCDYARRICPLGLRERSPLERVVVLAPTQWGQRSFDELGQRFLWELIDEQQQRLMLTLDWRESNESAIEFLELVRPHEDRLWGMLARIVFGAGLLVEPISLFSRGTERGHKVLNPAFDRRLIEAKQSGLLARLQAKYGRNQTGSTMTTDEETEDWLPASNSISSALESRLNSVEARLLRWGEMGLSRLSEEDSLAVRRSAQDLEQAGLSELAAALRRMETQSAAEVAIEARYLCRLHREALAAPRISTS